MNDYSTASLRNWRQAYDPALNPQARVWDIPEYMQPQAQASWEASNVINRMPHVFNYDQFTRGGAPVDQWPSAIANNIWSPTGFIANRMSGLKPAGITDIFAPPSAQGLGKPTINAGVTDFLNQFPGLMDELKKRFGFTGADTTTTGDTTSGQ